MSEHASAREVPERDRQGEVVGERFELLDRLGRGGVGEVWRAVDLDTRETVAVKLLRAELVGGGEVRERFRREAAAGAALDGPHTVRVLAFGLAGGDRPWLAMEYLRGRSLAELLREEGVLAPARAVAIASQACEALQAAHEHGLVHRDIKPSNLFLCEPEHVKVLDFGIAKVLEAAERLTGTGVMVGTPLYVSPEQAQALPVDGRSDLYSLGVVLHQMVSGRLPFQGSSVSAILIGHIQRPPPPLPEEVEGRPVPRALRELVLALLAKVPDERPATAAEVLGVLSETRLDRSRTA